MEKKEPDFFFKRAGMYITNKIALQVPIELKITQ